MLRLAVTTAIIACVLIQNPEQNPQNVGPMTPEAIAGTYFVGDGFFGNFLTLKADGRFSCLWIYDVGANRREEGTFIIADGMVDLRFPNLDKDPVLKANAPPKLHPIRWGKRIYLVSEAEMEAFCSLVNLGAEPRSEILGSCYVSVVRTRADREDVADLPAMAQPIGTPEVPDSWKPRLIVKPIEGKITQVLTPDRVTVNLGSADGLKPGMLLLVDQVKKNDYGVPYGLAKIVSVGDHTAVIEETRTNYFQEGFKIEGKVRSRIEDRFIDDCEFAFRRFRLR